MTRAKTSLVGSIHNFPSKYNLPFHAVEFSSLDSTPLISLDAGEERRALERRELVGLEHEAAEAHQVPAGPSSATAEYSDHSAISRKTGSVLNSPREASNASSAQPSAPSIKSIQNGHVLGESSDSGRVSSALKPLSIDHDPPAAPSHEAVSSYTQDWEAAPRQDMYAPSPNLKPWIQDDEATWGVEEEGTEHNLAAGPNDSTRAWSPTPYASPSTGQRNKKYEATQSGRRTTPRARVPGGSPAMFNGSWDEMVAGGQPRPASRPTRPASTGPLPERPIRSGVARNRHGQRIDMPLPRPSASDQQRFDYRTKNRKLCNEHHIRLACNNSKCVFDHEPIDAGILLALRNKARTLPCSVGPACERRDCFSGHHCPYSTKGRPCTKPRCPFKARGMHQVTDLTVVETLLP